MNKNPTLNTDRPVTAMPTQRQLRDIVQQVNKLTPVVRYPSPPANEAYRPQWPVIIGEPVGGSSGTPLAGKFSGTLIRPPVENNADDEDLSTKSVGTYSTDPATSKPYTDCEVWDISNLPAALGTVAGVNQDGKPIIFVSRPTQTVVVTGVSNDYLVCRSMDSTGGPIGPDIYVAKPWELRHTMAYYDSVTSLTTVSTQKVSATFSTGSELWEVRAPYLVGTGGKKATRIVISGANTELTRPDGTGTAVIGFIGLNIAGRAWTTTE